MRRFAAVSLFVLLASGCARQPAQSARVDPALAPLIPSDTLLLAGLRLDRIKETRFHRVWVEGRKLAFLEQFAARTGLDPRRDIHELVLAFDGQSSLVLIRGKFGGLFGLEPAFKQPGLQRISYKGMYIVHTGQSGVLFMNSGAAAAGRLEDLKALVDRRDQPKEQPPQALLDLVRQAPGTSHAWAVTTGAARLLPALPQSGEFANLARMARAAGAMRLHIDLSGGFLLEAEARCATPDAAQQIRDTVRAAAAVARLRTPDNQPELLRLFDGIRPTAVGDSFLLRIEQPFDLMVAAVEQLQIYAAGG
jgi:hypothetical protein